MSTVVAKINEAPRRKSRGLTAAFIRQKKAAGSYGDGNGLHLIVDPSGASRWQLRIQVAGKRRDVGLGGADTVTLADARDLAHGIRRQARLGQDPVAARRAQREGVPTFEAMAKTVHAAHLNTWRNGKHTAQWLATLEAYAFPVIGKLQVNRIETGDLLKLLMPIWTAKPETARRVMQRVRAVIDHATAAGHRSGENPCRIAAIGLPKQGDTVKHFAALPYADLSAFLLKLRAAESTENLRLALEFLILTAARSGEARGARWEEFDLEAKLWTIPAERMKAEREHVVPLSARAIEIVKRARALAPKSDLVFASNRSKAGALSDMALTMVLRRLKVEATAHGFRSTFRDWCSEETTFPSEVAEMALAHAIGSKVEAAYRRGKLLEKRRELMDAWEAFALGCGIMNGKPVGMFAASQFKLIEGECGVRFDDELRASLNETLEYWGEALSRQRQSTSPVAAHHRGRREAKRKRRLGLIRELALHYAAAGGIPKPNGYNREAGKIVGFSRFLQSIYYVLPSNARPPTVDTFIRDAEHLCFEGNHPHFELPSDASSKMLAPSRAKYMLEMMTRWRRCG